MIRRLETVQYRCLLDRSQEIGQFQILVGPNGSGKSTFLDVVRLLGDLLNNGLASAIRSRAPDFLSLVWMGHGSRFDLALELEIPRDRQARLQQNGFSRARYEVALGLNAKKELSILGEDLWLKPDEPRQKDPQRNLFPQAFPPRGALVKASGKHAPKGWKKVVSKKADTGNDYFISETTAWNNPFRLGPQKLALSNLPEDEERFPVATWVKRVLMEGIQYMVLNSESIRKPSPPGSPLDFLPDGSNLPWSIHNLSEVNPASFGRWIAHVRTALPDLETVETIERPEDKHRYLQVVYRSGLRAPSWTVSDGTLRLLALTLIAYLEGEGKVFLVEEPENGIHPQALETVFQSLSSGYESQVLCATHSPVFLSLAEPEQLLCFALTQNGATDIVRGDLHPNLREWKRTADLGTLFAAGVLG